MHMPTHLETICALCIVTLCTITCGRIEQEPVLDEEGDPIEFPPPLEEWLQITSITPAPTNDLLGDEPTFLIQFNQYLQEDSAISYGVVNLKTGARSASGAYEHLMVDRALLWTPNRNLRDGFEYKLEVSGNNLRSVTGAPTPPEHKRALVFRVDATLESPFPSDLEQARVGWPEVRALFDERGCYSCHGQPSWHRLNPLEYDDLVGIKAAQVDRFLVRFKDPTNSYLMHKILADYPVRRGTLQPPPWRDDLRPLTRQEIWLVEQWIRQGAVRNLPAP